jgi:hypothetical protein
VADQISAWNANFLSNALTVTLGSGTITVEGTATGVTQALTITIDEAVDIIWKAKVEGENVEGLIRLENSSGSGNFTVESGGEIIGGHEALLTLSGFNIIVKNGGLVKSVVDRTVPSNASVQDKAIASEWNGGDITIEAGAKVEAPFGTAIHTENGGNLSLGTNTSGIVGIVSVDPDEGNLWDGEQLSSWVGRVYGNVTLKKGFNSLAIADSGDELYVEPGAELEVENEVFIEDGAHFNIWGTVRLLLDPGILNNSGVVTIHPGGKIINEYEINNESGGEIINKGTVDNTNGAINNAGHIYSDTPIANVSENDVEPLPKDNAGSGGGCAVGFGIIPLLFGCLVILKKKRG